MTEGTPIPRQFLLVTKDGRFVLDWGNHRFQDIYSGESVILENEMATFPIKENELNWLKSSGTISGYDVLNVYIFNLPDFNQE